MSGQWRGSDRRSRLPSNWPQIRLAALRRDGYQCQHPGCTDQATDVDHVEAGDDHSLENLQALCAFHHRKKSAGEGNAAYRKRMAQLRAMTRRKPEENPGAIPKNQQKPRKNKGW